MGKPEPCAQLAPRAPFLPQCPPNRPPQAPQQRRDLRCHVACSPACAPTLPVAMWVPWRPSTRRMGVVRRSGGASGTDWPILPRAAAGPPGVGDGRARAGRRRFRHGNGGSFAVGVRDAGAHDRDRNGLGWVLSSRERCGRPVLGLVARAVLATRIPEISLTYAACSSSYLACWGAWRSSEQLVGHGFRGRPGHR